jgi:hypothetical protein
LRGWGEEGGGGAEWVVGRGWGQRGEMTKTLYAHKNNKRKKNKIKFKKKKKEKLCTKTFLALMSVG